MTGELLGYICGSVIANEPPIVCSNVDPPKLPRALGRVLRGVAELPDRLATEPAIVLSGRIHWLADEAKKLLDGDAT